MVVVVAVVVSSTSTSGSGTSSFLEAKALGSRLNRLMATLMGPSPKGLGCLTMGRRRDLPRLFAIPVCMCFGSVK